MIKDNFKFLDQISNGAILVNNIGLIVYFNEHITKLVKLAKMDTDLETIFEIDNDFDEKHIQGNSYGKIIYFGKLSLETTIFPIEIENQKLYMYFFKESYINSPATEELINSIDDIVIVLNKFGQYEKGNEAIRTLLGFNPDDIIGKRPSDLKNENVTENPVALEVMKSKKKMNQNVSYSNGKTITYTAIPILDDNEEVVKVILTGRDISKLVTLEKELKKAEKLKNEYLNKLEDLRKNKESFEIIYSSEQMHKLIKLVRKAAKIDSSVFIMGESGVGKEVIANFIHNNSARKDGPFVAINCAAIPSELFESELFGHEEGSFTGSKKGGKIGLFEKAKGGTVFLDEIGELPMKMQSKLLRAVQENGINRVGGNDFIPIDVRYICATNLSKKDLSNNHKFRQDLYYRLGVVPINIPSLKNRKDDIIPLVHHFLDLFNNKYECQLKISKEVMKLLVSYNWPGNVRELKNVVERMVIFSEDDVITESEFTSIIHIDEERGEIEEQPGIVINRFMNLNEAYKLVDEMLIKRALDQYGTVVKAAEMLEINPSTIHRKMKKGYNFQD